MPTYTTNTNVKDELPDLGTPAAISDSDIDTIISECSDEVDVRVGKKYARQYKSSTQKFPDITDSPATPTLIERCCRWLVIAECYARIEIANRSLKTDGKKSLKEHYREKAIATLKEIALNNEMDLNIAVENKFYSIEKYPDDESAFDRIFTNDELDTYLYQGD